jgi:hypothetical protein
MILIEPIKLKWFFHFLSKAFLTALTMNTSYIRKNHTQRGCYVVIRREWITLRLPYELPRNIDGWRISIEQQRGQPITFNIFTREELDKMLRQFPFEDEWSNEEDEEEEFEIEDAQSQH